MHLGGQVVITSYKIQDNERSTRYILTSLSKVTIALYVFYKTWSSNEKKLLAATVLLFIAVIIRCFEKALALKRTSFNALPKPDSFKVKFVDQLQQLLTFIKLAKEGMDRAPTLGTQGIARLPCHLFQDFPRSYSDRLMSLMDFWWLDRESAYGAIEGALSDMTSFLYTKNIAPVEAELYLDFKNAPKFIRIMYKQLLVVATFTIAMSLAFPKHRKEPLPHKDSVFTLWMLQGTISLEVVYLVVYVLFHVKFSDRSCFKKFSGRILQHNLIGFFSHTRRPSKLRTIAGWLHCKDWLDSFWHMEPSNSCKEIVELVRCHVETGWNEYISDPCSYRMFNDSRGEWTLERNGYLQQLGWSTRRPFDESVVLWHLATDLYIHQTCTSPDDHVSARQCKLMSNCMAHLLFNNPEMLMPGSKRRLLVTACEELEALLEGEMTPRCERVLLTRIASEKRDRDPRLSQEESASFICNARKITESLLGFDDQTKIWELIQGVWVEMLCFSASRCRGYLHAEALGTGVEFLSYVWILLIYTGMETFPEKLQRREFHSAGFGLARERGDVVTPLAAQSESTVDIVIED